MKFMKNQNGFSLIEVVVVTGMLSLLVAGAFMIGLPEYNNYILSSEREYLSDTLQEAKVRSFASGGTFVVSAWTGGYCIKDISDLCVVPVHNLPLNMIVSSESSTTIEIDYEQ